MSTSQQLELLSASSSDSPNSQLLTPGMHSSVPLSALKPASYNPRKIDRESSEALDRSLAILGQRVPLVATREGVLVAGHQRHSSMMRIGMTTCRCFVVDVLDEEDEIRFNQLHNGADTSVSQVRVMGPLSPGLGLVQSSRVDVTLPSPGASQRNEWCRLIARHGGFGAAVCAEDGTVIYGQDYAASCFIMRQDLEVNVVPNDLLYAAREAFSRTYGQFSYELIERRPWIQTLAQIKRMREAKPDRATSPVYKELLLRGCDFSRVFDFGSGQGDAARRFGSFEWEPYRRFKNSSEIDASSVSAMASKLSDRLRSGGRFDVVVVDYVLNSVQSMKEHDQVVRAASSFVTPGGSVFFSGRRAEFCDRLIERYTSRAGRSVGRSVEFRDENGFSALKRGGQWFFQRFHYASDIERLGELLGSRIVSSSNTEAEWFVELTTSGEVFADDVVAEFSMPTPDGSMGFAADVLDALKFAQQRERHKETTT